jgi:hypothetical protein
MTKEEIVKFIIESINLDNREICTRGNMDPEQIEKSIENSQQSLNYIVGNLYDRLKEKQIIA